MQYAVFKDETNQRTLFQRGVINEGLRLSGVITRLPRRAPDEALKYKQWTIPPNVRFYILRDRQR